AVRVCTDDGQFLTGEDLVVIVFLVHTQADAFVLNGLARTIDRPVGEEDGLVVSLGSLVAKRGILLLRSEFSTVVPDAEQVVAILFRFEGEETVLVGGDWRTRNATPLVVQMPGHHFRATYRATRCPLEPR